MSNAKRLIVGLVVLVGVLILTGCATVQAPPELVKAIEAGDVGLVETIVGVNPKLVNSTGNFPKVTIEGISPLYYAVMTNNRDMVKLLLEKGANVNAKVTDFQAGETPFLAALTNGKIEVLPLLIEGGADLEARGSFGDTPLYSVMGRRYNFFDKVTKGPKLTKIPNAKDMAMLLIENGANVKVSKGGRTLLHHAAESGWYDLAELLIEKGVDVNAKAGSKGNFPGYTALHYTAIRFVAQEQTCMAIAKLLIANGANVNVKDSIGQTPLFVAISFGKKEIAELLIANGADVNMRTKYFHPPVYAVEKDSNSFRYLGEDRAPLDIAVLWNKIEITEILISNGADINAKSAKGNTPLHKAARNRHEEVLGILLENGANSKIKNKDGDTPLAIAIKKGGKNIIDLLKKHGAVE